MGYSLSMMGDFQKCIISQIFSVFLERFFVQDNFK